MQITASHIINWANTKTKEAQANLPRLIRRLCFDAKATRQIAFPAGDSTFVPGWDGVLSSDTGNAWIPTGPSFWEIGCDQEVFAKINSDYQKRLKATSAEIRAASTFVFVTPRRWINKTKWLAEHKSKNEWADVRAYDGDDLEQWLEQTPAVALQFSEELGLNGFGVESPSRHWAAWSQQCSPAITVEAFQTDRLLTRDELIKKIQASTALVGISQPIVVRGDSVEEAVAFIASALLDSPELSGNSIVVTHHEGWRFVEANQQICVAVCTQTDIASSPPQRNGLVIIVPHAVGAKATEAKVEDPNQVFLERPNIYEFEKALIAIGTEESDARRLSLSTGRSWTVLRRQTATNPAIQRPTWLATSQAASLVTLCLLGAWDANEPIDRQIVERLTDQPYEDIDRDLRVLSQVNDPPVWNIGGVWSAKSPLELLNLFGSQITSAQLDRFFAIAQELLSSPDPQLELEDKDRFAAQFYGKRRPESALLLESVCDALLKLAVRGPDQAQLLALHIDSRVEKLVFELLSDASPERWLCLSSHIPTLAEAAPDVFLKAIETSLQLPDAPVTRLLTETSASGFGGRCWHAGLLWALELTAWAPNLLTRTALVLAQLCKVTIKGNWGNSPKSSLFGIFRAWLPQTAANVSARITVLDYLIGNEPGVAFGILEGLRESGPQGATPAHRPKWRDDDAGAGRGATYADLHAMNSAAKERLFKLALGNSELTVRLLKTNVSRKFSSIDMLESLLEPFTHQTTSDVVRENLCAPLRNIINWHRNYDDSPVDVLEPWLLKMEALYARLQPVEVVARHRWLFSNGWVDLPMKDTGEGHEDKSQALHAHRTAALSEIYTDCGMSGFDALVATCTGPYIIGSMLVDQHWDGIDWSQWIIRIGEDFLPEEGSTNCVSSFMRNLPDARRFPLLQAVVKQAIDQGWPSIKLARLLVQARCEKTTWQLATACGTDTETAYWKLVQPYLWDKGDKDYKKNFDFIVFQLLEHKRPRTAMNFCQFDLELITSKQLLSALQQFLKNEEPNASQLESWHIAKMLERLEASSDIEKLELIQLEFALFPALQHGQESSAKALYESVTSDPNVFTELLCYLYKPAHGEREEPVTDALETAAHTAWDIFRACRRIPGVQADGSIDRNTFIQFVEAARDQCREADRLTMCDQTLGGFLAHSSSDDDGAWPCAVVRNMLNRADMEAMRKGFTHGVLNKRGVTSRSLADGGSQERDLAATYRGYAEQVQLLQPNMASVLEKLAQYYERDGRREDVEASLRKESF
jgi:hypothetical protein